MEKKLTRAEKLVAELNNKDIVPKKNVLPKNEIQTKEQLKKLKELGAKLRTFKDLI